MQNINTKYSNSPQLWRSPFPIIWQLQQQDIVDAVLWAVAGRSAADQFRRAVVFLEVGTLIFNSLNQWCGSNYIEFGSGSRVIHQFWKIFFLFQKSIFFKKKFYFLKTIGTKCHLKIFLLSCVYEFWIYILNLILYIFCLHFILYLHVWIRIHNTGLKYQYFYSFQWSLIAKFSFTLTNKV